MPPLPTNGGQSRARAAQHDDVPLFVHGKIIKAVAIHVTCCERHPEAGLAGISHRDLGHTTSAFEPERPPDVSRSTTTTPEQNMKAGAVERVAQHVIDSLLPPGPTVADGQILPPIADEVAGGQVLDEIGCALQNTKSGVDQTDHAT